jgi:hypothetical protein
MNDGEIPEPKAFLGLLERQRFCVEACLCLLDLNTEQRTKIYGLVQREPARQLKHTAMLINASVRLCSVSSAVMDVVVGLAMFGERAAEQPEMHGKLAETLLDALRALDDIAMVYGTDLAGIEAIGLARWKRERKAFLAITGQDNQLEIFHAA